MTHLIIIGTGLAGYHVAREWRKHDQSSSLTLVTEDAGDFYSKPQLSIALANDRDPSQLVMKDKDAMAAELSADIYNHTHVTQINKEQKNIVLGDERVLSYDQLVLATGSMVRQLTLSGDAVARVLSVNSLEDYVRWRQALSQKSSLRVGVIGSGLVGTEFAHDLACTGHQVDVLSPEDYPLARLLPPEMGMRVSDAMRDKGVNWHWRQSVSAVHQASNHFRLETVSGQSFEVDVVLSAVGVQSNVSLARAAGLAVEHGVVVDSYYRSSDEHIYALGDCAQCHGEVRFYVQPLLAAAKAMAKTLSGVPTQVVLPPKWVTIKTSLCPVGVLIPDAVAGVWQVDAAKEVARFVDESGEMRGFALCGAGMKQKMSLMKEMNDT